MTITRLTGNAVTYGGYVNVSRQNIDFSSPSMMDAIINDLAAQYAIQTEAALGTQIQAIANNVELAPVAVGNTPSAAELVAGLWTAAGTIYNAVKGQGQAVPGCAAGPSGQLGWRVLARSTRERGIRRVQRKPVQLRHPRQRRPGSRWFAHLATRSRRTITVPLCPLLRLRFMSSG